MTGIRVLHYAVRLAHARYVTIDVATGKEVSARDADGKLRFADTRSGIAEPRPATRTVKSSAGVTVGLCLEWSSGRDPDTGEALDRSWMWRAFLNGEPVPLEDVHAVIQIEGRDEPYVKGERIDEIEYLRLVEDRAWAREHAPADPAANPRQAINRAKMPPIKFPKRTVVTKGESP